MQRLLCLAHAMHVARYVVSSNTEALLLCTRSCRATRLPFPAQRNLLRVYVAPIKLGCRGVALCAASESTRCAQLEQTLERVSTIDGGHRGQRATHV